MRVALFSDTFPPDINGVANSTSILFNELIRHGHDTYVITTRPGAGGSEWDKSGRILRLAGVELKSLYGYVMTSPFHINALNEIRKLHLDVIHAQTEFGVGIFARICCKQLNIPLVSTYHTTYEDYTHYVNFTNSPKVDQVAKKAVARLSRFYGDSSIEVIAPSEKTKEMLLGYQVRTQINVVPTGLELYKFDPKQHDPSRSDEIRRSYGFADTDKVIIYVGRIAEEKSLDLVIDAFAEAKKQGLKNKLLIIGTGPEEEALKKKADELQLQGTVVFGGRKPAEEIPAYYWSSNAFISASLTETQGMTFIEALASGLPVFARKDEVLDNLVIPGKTGYYFSGPADFCDELRVFNQRSDTERETQKEACLDAVHPYSSEVFYDRVKYVYESAIEKYSHMYLIDDVRVKDDYVQLFITYPNSDEEIRIMVSLDDFYNTGLSKGGMLSKERIEELKKQEVGVKAYEGCLRRLAVKDRTRKEIYDWLTQNTECSIEVINAIVDRLEEKDYINDERYCAESIASMRLALQGEEKIIRTLKKKGLSYEMIQEKLDEVPDDEAENALRYANKTAAGIHDSSVRMKKSLLRSKLIQRGYSSEIADEIIGRMDFTDDETQELDSLRKCALKARKRYEKKYQSSQLRNTVYRYCAAKGYSNEDIYAILDEMEWEDDKD